MLRKCYHHCYLLADRTNGRAYATLLRPSVRRLSPSSVIVFNVMYCIVAKRCVLEKNVTIDSL